MFIVDVCVDVFQWEQLHGKNVQAHMFSFLLLLSQMVNM